MTRVKKPVKEIWGTEKQPEGQTISKKKMQRRINSCYKFSTKIK